MISVSRPHRHVLIAVTGLSPAVITETLWALAVDSKHPIVPERVVVITTTLGANQIKASILSKNVWYDFKRALAVASGIDTSLKLSFGTAQDNIRIIPAPLCEAVTTDASDIRNASDHEAAADFIMRTVREFSEDPDTSIIFSVAGGRKTMGSLLFSVANLLGRPNDRITHVLVNEPYDNSAYGFLYPGFMLGAEPLPKNTPEPKIELAEIPFVPLRLLFAKDLGGRISGYMDLVRDLNSKVHAYSEVSRLVIDTKAQSLMVNDEKLVRIGPKAFVLMLGYAWLAKNGNLRHTGIVNVIDAIRDAFAVYGTENDMAWIDEARLALNDKKAEWQADVHKSLYGLRTRLINKLGLTKPQTDRIVPHRERMSIDLDAESITIK